MALTADANVTDAKLSYKWDESETKKKRQHNNSQPTSQLDRREKEKKRWAWADGHRNLTGDRTENNRVVITNSVFQNTIQSHMFMLGPW